MAHLARIAGGLLLLALLALQWHDSPVHRFVRNGLFSAYQQIHPRARQSLPAMVVAIDETSIARHGQWPWPRRQLAELIERIGESGPAAIGLDMIMPEPDPIVTGGPPLRAPHMRPDLVRRLRAAQTNDAILARALGGHPVVLGVAGLSTKELPQEAGPPRAAPFWSVGGEPAPLVARYDRWLGNVPELAEAARGQGLLNTHRDEGTVQRLPLLASVSGTLLPAFGLELMRVAANAPGYRVEVGQRGVELVLVGNRAIPAERDGSAWLHYAPPDPARSISAADVLARTFDAQRLRGKLVVVGVTALGFSERLNTPLGRSTTSAEIHTQLLESAFDGRFLSRPHWAPLLEAVLLAMGGLAVIVTVPALRRRYQALLALVIPAMLPLFGLVMFVRGRLLVDGASPALAVIGVYALVLGLTLAESERQRRRLHGQLADSHEAAARLEGELEAARRAQLAMLPSAPAVAGDDPRVDVVPYMQPSRVVGGDLYDFFFLGDDRLFVLVGDVSGKGLAASLFMGVCKALTKSAALRLGADLRAVVEEANRETCRDNRESLFVTAVAGILELATGAFEYCSAGHEPPYLVRRDGTVARLPLEGGPPLCVLEDYRYGSARLDLAAGEVLCFYTDGVTEATEVQGRLYGHARLRRRLGELSTSAPLEDWPGALRDDVLAFSGETPQADDITLVLVRWNGPGAGDSGDPDDASSRL